MSCAGQSAPWAKPEMTETAAAQLKQLLRERSVAALGTLHAGAPYVSMVPYAIAHDGSGLIIHVSALGNLV